MYKSRANRPKPRPCSHSKQIYAAAAIVNTATAKKSSIVVPVHASCLWRATELQQLHSFDESNHSSAIQTDFNCNTKFTQSTYVLYGIYVWYLVCMSPVESWSKNEIINDTAESFLKRSEVSKLNFFCVCSTLSLNSHKRHTFNLTVQKNKTKHSFVCFQASQLSNPPDKRAMPSVRTEAGIA